MAKIVKFFEARLNGNTTFGGAFEFLKLKLSCHVRNLGKVSADCIYPFEIVTF